MKYHQKLWTFVFILAGLFILMTSPVFACGGLFCQTVPVLQESENIIFAINDNETITATVQIIYTGDAPNFSWVVPVPSVPVVDVAEPELFEELIMLTDPIIVPPRNDCPLPTQTASATMMDEMEADMMAPTPDLSQVEVLAEGSVGPYDFHVVTSEDRDALIFWLRTNQYRVDPPMEPLIHLYSDEGMVFLAMKLQPEAGVEEIQPVQMTYEGTNPMIPIRLTAVAAVENMSVNTWIFADAQTIPMNYAYPTVKNTDLRADFSQIGGTNYLQLVDQTVDLYEGRAFVTEYAMPSDDLLSMHPDNEDLLELIADHAYVTRFFGRMSPAEMTVDPIFSLAPELPNFPNVRDLSDYSGAIFWGCESQPIQLNFDPSVVPDGFQ